MSFNQSRSDKNESYTQYRKSGRSTSFSQQRGSSGTHSKPGGAGGSAPSPSIASNRSFKKSNNIQGGRAGAPTVNSTDLSNAPNPRGVQNGDYAPTQSRVVKPTETPPTQRSTRDVPKAPTSQSSPMSSDPAAPTTPAKGAGDQSKEFSFQFGSISPGFMNGVQIPVRTSSAPPNLDEQKRDQVRHDSFRPGPPLPIPSAPKPQAQRKDDGAVDQPNIGQQLQKKDIGTVNQPNNVEAHAIQKAKKDMQTSPTHPTNPSQKPTTHSISGISMPMPFHQPQVSVPFGGPNQQMQSPGITASSLHMSMPVPLQIGSSPQVQQQMFVPGLHPHPMQSQGIIHQGQSLGFATQIGSQLPPQLGSIGINVSSQYSQQQGGKFGGPRKSSVRITDPKTHEELIFDNKQADAFSDTSSSGPRPQYNIPSQTQPLPYATNHAMNFYTNSYNHNPLYFASPSSVPLSSGQSAPNSQAHRYNYPVSQGSQSVSYISPPPVGSPHVKKTGGSSMQGITDLHTRDSHSLHPPSSSGAVNVTIKMPADPVAKVTESLPNRSATGEGKSQKPLNPTAETITSAQRTSDIVGSEGFLQDSKVEEPLLLKPSPVASRQSLEPPPSMSLDGQDSSCVQSSLASSSEEPKSIIADNEGRRETLMRSDSHKDHQKKASKKGHAQLQHQPTGHSTSSLGVPAGEHDMASPPVVSETLEATSSSNLVEGVSESASEMLPPITNDSESKDAVLASNANTSSGTSGSGNTGEDTDPISDTKQVNSLKDKPAELVFQRTEEQGQGGNDDQLVDLKISEISSERKVSKLLEATKQVEKESIPCSTTVSNEVSSPESAQKAVDEPVTCHAGVENITDSSDVSISRSRSSPATEKPLSDELERNVNVGSSQVVFNKGGRSNQPCAPAQNLELSEGKRDGEVLDALGSGASVVQAVTSANDRSVVETSKSKSTSIKGKKKRKEILQKADAAGSTSDLYMAYKGPEEKKERVIRHESTESTESRSSSVDLKQESIEALKEAAVVHSKGEPDDWEDAADVATPKLESTHEDTENLLVLDNGDKVGDMAKKYSKDFLLKFREQFVDLPPGFKITPEIESLVSNANISYHLDRDSYPSPGRTERPSSGGSRLDRRGSNVVDDDRWSKSGPFVTGQDPRLDLAYGANAGFRPGQGASFGVLRNPRAQAPVQYAGGILAGPMQSIGSQGGMQRHSPDAERWQRATNFQKGLIPSPQTPLQTMHRAKNKYEVGKVSDEEQTKQRQLKAILNKLTPQNFEKLFDQVKAVNIDNSRTLTGVISQIFDKALMEPTFCEMYANFCFHLAGELPDLNEDNEKITFKRLLLNKCQEEFERGEREQEEANKGEEEGEVKQSEEEREEKRIKARRRMLGNIRLIGELYKKKMLTERIMHECIKKLLGEYQNPDEEDVEALCKLMSTIGEMIDHPRAKDYMDSYFEIMTMLSNNMKLSSRVRFMLKDAIDLRKNKWQQRRKVEGPKKIEEVHRDAAQERQAQTGRFGRGPGISSSGRRGLPADFGPRGSAVSSPSAQGFRGYPVRGYGSQDARQEERQSYEAKPLAVPLPQRPSGDDSITLGPQGGLARGMSIRGTQPVSTTSSADSTPLPGDFRSPTTVSLNGYSSVSERATFTNKEDLIPRHTADRFAGPTSLEHLSGQERYSNYGNRDTRHSGQNFDRSRPISPAAQGQGPTPTSNPGSKKAMTEDRMRELSLEAIREFYSANDEEEVVLCIKDLNSPHFYPTMICLWVTDSFERKDWERDLLARLIVNLSRSHDGTLNQTHLVRGFESVLATLEDAVNDAPRAPEFFSRILAKVILEKLVSIREIGELIYQGGEEPGGLVQAGLAADVIGNILEAVRLEKGDSFLNEMRSNLNLSLEKFRPPDPLKSKVLEKFI